MHLIPHLQPSGTGMAQPWLARRPPVNSLRWTSLGVMYHMPTMLAASINICPASTNARCGAMRRYATLLK